MTTLYAWVRPLDVDHNVDHTWVTDYAPPPVYDKIEDVIAGGENYWYCWGSYHPKGVSATYPKGAIGNASGNLKLSSCLVGSNSSDAHGTIFTYLWDGVCHQLANQVLYSTSGPLTVKLARGYSISSFFFGTYGSNPNDFFDKVTQCSGQVNVMTSSTPPDDFELKFLKVIGEGVHTQASSDIYDQLMEVRNSFQNDLQTLREEFAPDGNPELIAVAANKLIASYLKQASEILGAETFKQLFDVEEGQAPSLIDPQFIDTQNLNLR